MLGESERLCSARELGHALVRTVEQLEQWATEAGIADPSYYNFAVTDGQNVAALRYVSHQRLEPASLYYSAGKKYVCYGGLCQMVDGEPGEQAVIIASERLTEQKSDWVRVAPNHVLTVAARLEVEVELVNVERRASPLVQPHTSRFLIYGFRHQSEIRSHGERMTTTLKL